MINVTEQEVDREIVAALKQVREILGFDRFGLLTFSPDKREMMVTHSVMPRVLPRSRRKRISASCFPGRKGACCAGK